jgi:ABC-type transport system substrate-binding protein
MTTLLITATAFDDRTCLSYSFHYDDREGDQFSPIQQCDADHVAWAYLLHWLPESMYDAVRIAVIDRRPGTRATSRCCGHSLT